MLAFHWFTLGALGMMLGYMTFQFSIHRRLEYLHFSSYLLLTWISFFMILQFYKPSNRIELLLYHASYSTIPFLSFIAYLNFMDHLLEIKNKMPALNRVMKWFIYLILTMTVADVVLYSQMNEFKLHYQLANLVRLLVIILGVAGSYMLIKKGEKESLYFGAGTIVLAIAGLVTTYINIFKPLELADVTNVFSTGAFYYRSGVIIQMLLFAMGISHKMKQSEIRRSELELELVKEKYSRELERQKAIEQTRTSIAEDLHDDIGATLSSINIYSKLANDKLKKESGKSEPLLDKISNTSQEMMNNMSDVIWAIKPGHDSMDMLTFRIKSLMQDTFEPLNIKYYFDKELEGNNKISMQAKRNIYLIVKEALNNAAKYSSATEIRVSMKSDDEKLSLDISDNGRGFVMEETEKGNGLKNMQHRAKQSGGEIKINSESGKGTFIRVEFENVNINY